MNQEIEYDAVIVGAGLAGLSAANALHAAGRKILAIEKSDRIGGRLRTDVHEGFRLDHGFQVLLTAYPQCKKHLDYKQLDLGCFEPGALLWNGKSLNLVADPIRQPTLALKTLKSGAGTLTDKLRIAKLALTLAARPIDSIYNETERSAEEALRQYGFSDSMLEVFMRPFFRGIFLEPDLTTSSRMLNFVFKCFGSGHAALPAKGMADIPHQLANALPAEAIQLNQAVKQISQNYVTTESGQTVKGRSVVLATDMSAAARLSNTVADRGWNATKCFYFKAETSPLPRPMIALNASANGIIENVCVPSDISPSYAPTGQSLICVSTRPVKNVDASRVAAELEEWFGAQSKDFERLRSYTIPQSLPRQLPGDCAFGKAPLRDSNGIWLCGDHRFSSSIEGAMKSGRLVAEAILN